jgi:hypothetical protein
MKKLLLLGFLITAKIGFSQVYQQGDIFVNTSFFGNHDSTQCGTFGDLYYDFTINNSFLGDSLLIKNAGTNYLIVILKIQQVQTHGVFLCKLVEVILLCLIIWQFQGLLTLWECLLK